MHGRRAPSGKNHRRAYRKKKPLGSDAGGFLYARVPPARARSDVSHSPRHDRSPAAPAPLPSHYGSAALRATASSASPGRRTGCRNITCLSVGRYPPLRAWMAHACGPLVPTHYNNDFSKLAPLIACKHVYHVFSRLYYIYSPYTCIYYDIHSL